MLCPGATLSSLTAAVVTGDKDNLEAAYERLSSKYPGGKAPRPEDMANAAVWLGSTPDDQSGNGNGTAATRVPSTTTQTTPAPAQAATTFDASAYPAPVRD